MTASHLYMIWLLSNTKAVLIRRKDQLVNITLHQMRDADIPYHIISYHTIPARVADCWVELHFLFTRPAPPFSSRIEAYIVTLTLSSLKYASFVMKVAILVVMYHIRQYNRNNAV